MFVFKNKETYDELFINPIDIKFYINPLEIMFDLLYLSIGPVRGSLFYFHIQYCDGKLTLHDYEFLFGVLFYLKNTIRNWWISR